MQRTLCFRVVSIMFKNLLSQWRNCLLLRAVKVDRGSMCHVSEKTMFSFLFFFNLYHSHQLPVHPYQLSNKADLR